MFPARRRPITAVAIIERCDNHILIVLPSASDDRARMCRFPHGLTRADESPEAATRRIAYEQLGIRVEIVVGQPPVIATLDGRDVEVRCFFCGVTDGEPRPGPDAEIRWVSKGRLREYEFDALFENVIKWLLES